MTVKKRKLFTDYEKEEKWLNDMADKGLHLVHYSFFTYTFETGKPGEYQYRIQLLKYPPSHLESQTYISFMEENNVEFVDSYIRWVYFRKKTAEGPFEIYSDNASRIKHYHRIAGLMGAAGGVNLLIALGNLPLSTLNRYVSLLNWLIVIIIIPFFVSYLRKGNKLKKEMELYDK
ncbi:DUF2812 domain-containing protein [Lentibacillus sp. N15]|uniref:DUF2812 domain-containing protein n=1 Tax=Lentibacillus songyuanensis TaxID=3136161 RepID=UPI0031BA40D3